MLYVDVLVKLPSSENISNIMCGRRSQNRSSQVLLTSMVSAAQAQQTVSATSFMQKLGPELVAQGLTSHLVENTCFFGGGLDFWKKSLRNWMLFCVELKG